MELQRQERRSQPRVVVNMPMRFRAPDMHDFETGELVNMSESGVFIATPRQLVIGSRVDLSSEVNQHIDVTVTVIRFDARLELNTKRGDCWFWYGCRIEKPQDQAA